jgi:hypothetical protein
MQTAAKLGIGLGVAAATAGTVAWSKVAYEDAVHDRNNDRNSLVNIGLWVGTVGAGGAGALALRVARPAAPWLFGASALMGVNAFASAAAAENGWEKSGIAYCNFGFCNRTAGAEHGAPSIYLGRPNPLEKSVEE